MTGDCSQNSTDPLEEVEEEIYLEDINDDITLSPKRR
jgi:hypothetical protein